MRGVFVWSTYLIAIMTPTSLVMYEPCNAITSPTALRRIRRFDATFFMRFIYIYLFTLGTYRYHDNAKLNIETYSWYLNFFMMRFLHGVLLCDALRKTAPTVMSICIQIGTHVTIYNSKELGSLLCKETLMKLLTNKHKSR
jgi:hypothetical protein